MLPLIKEQAKKATSETRIPQNDLTEDNIFVEIEVVTPKLNETERREVIPEENNSQINPSTETHIETVQKELFETPIGGSTRESIATNTNNKSRSTKISALKVTTQQKRDSLLETTERSEGEEFSNRNTQNFYFAKCYRTTTSNKKCVGNNKTTETERLFFLIKDSNSEENFDNDVFF